MKKDILLLMLCLFCSIGAMAQTKTITGVVSDAAGEPIIGIPFGLQSFKMAKLALWPFGAEIVNL